jgi:hypothetical protein
LRRAVFKGMFADGELRRKERKILAWDGMDWRM